MWTVVGSTAGVVAAVVAVAAVTLQVRSGRNDSKVTAELAPGQIDQMGVLRVEFASGKTDVLALSKPGKVRASEKLGSGKNAKAKLEFSPVNVIFIRNLGHSPVTVSRCHYISDLGGAGFRFEPQPAASKRGDHLPIRLNPGEDAVLVHEFVAMRVFLNHVLRDHEVDAAVFNVVLTLGDGNEISASPAMLIQADMSMQELATAPHKLVRQWMPAQNTFVRHKRSGYWRWPRRTR